MIRQVVDGVGIVFIPLDGHIPVGTFRFFFTVRTEFDDRQVILVSQLYVERRERTSDEDLITEVVVDTGNQFENVNLVVNHIFTS